MVVIRHTTWMVAPGCLRACRSATVTDGCRPNTTPSNRTSYPAPAGRDGVARNSPPRDFRAADADW
jgi:hypothetical protein